MVKIYTKTGDKGETALVGGVRVSKSDFRVDAYGEVDELNSVVGLAATGATEHQELLQNVQSALFDLGAYLACETEKREQFKINGINHNIIETLEREIDKLTKELDPLKTFILPGGSRVAAELHMARTVTRRVERTLVLFEEKSNEENFEEVKKFVNRLSDFFFVLARYYNKKSNVKDIAWIAAKD